MITSHVQSKLRWSLDWKRLDQTAQLRRSEGGIHYWRSPDVEYRSRRKDYCHGFVRGTYSESWDRKLVSQTFVMIEMHRIHWNFVSRDS